MINEDINVSSEGGVVDIFFKTETNGNENNNNYYSDISSDDISSQDEYM